MQKDFMSMAQGQQASPITPQDVPDEQMYQEMGMPTGNTKEDAKKRLFMILDELGILKGLSKEGLRELTEKVNEYVELAEKGDMQALESHPIGQLLAQASSEIAQQGKTAAPGQAPKDFSSMMPPGGGMSGR